MPSTQKGGDGGGKGPFEDVEVAAMPNGDFVVAVRKGANEARRDGQPRAADRRPSSLTARSPGPHHAGDPAHLVDAFPTVAVNPDNVLALKSWELGAGSITHLAHVRGPVAGLQEASAARPLAIDIYTATRRSRPSPAQV